MPGVSGVSGCNYRNYDMMFEGDHTMTSGSAVRELKLIAIGNSRGIRLPKVMLEKYGWSESLVVEETDDGVFLRGGTADKLSWEDTYREMAAEREDWSDLDLTLADGLE